MGIAVPMTTDSGKNIALVAQPVDLSRTPAEIVSLLPEAGADNDEILKELGFAEHEIQALRDENVF